MNLKENTYKELLDLYTNSPHDHLIEEMLIVYFDVQKDQRLHISKKLDEEIDKFFEDPLYLLMSEKERDSVIQFYRLQRTKEELGSRRPRLHR
mgnify:CR=1 FL=1